MALAPLWPAYGEAIARGDMAWVRQTLRRSLALAVGSATVFSLALVVLGPRIIIAWVGNEINPPLILLIAFAIWKIVEAGGNALAVFLNGAHVVKAQVIVSILTCIAALTMKIQFWD